MLGKINKRVMARKIRKGERPFLCTTQCVDLIHISIKVHEDILNIAKLWRVRECLEKINQSGITQKLREGEGQSFLCTTHHPDLIDIPINLHEDIPNGY